jgi:hypothetical protein
MSIWELREGNDLRDAIVKRAASGARARLRELRGEPPEPAVIEEPVKEEEAGPPKPDDSQLAALLETEDERQWTKAVRQILAAYGENMRRLTSLQRDTHIVECRATVARYLRDRGWSYPRIGQFMHRDHSSIIHLLEPEKRRLKYVKVRELVAAAYRAEEGGNA